MSSAVTMRDNHTVTLVNSMASDDQVAMSAWISFGNDDEVRLEDRERVKGLINFLYRNQHMTPFESSVFTFRIETPIFVAREFFRHRAASYNEWSGRYSEMLPQFYAPHLLRPIIPTGKYSFKLADLDHHLAEIEAHRLAGEFCWKLYEDSLARGTAKEVARNVLPLSTYTRFYVTMNARMLMHFLGLRTAEDALYEIRDVAGQMYELVKDIMPFTFGAFGDSHA